MGKSLEQIKRSYVTTDVEGQSTFLFNNTNVIVQIECGIIVGEAYRVNTELDHLNLLKLLNRDYQKEEYLDTPNLGQAFIHKKYNIICYKKDFSFIFAGF